MREKDGVVERPAASCCGGADDYSWGRRSATKAELLPEDVPVRGADRAAGGDGEGEADLRHGPCNVESLLP